MPKIPKIKLAAEYLLKLADEHEQMQAPSEVQELPAHEQEESLEEEAGEHPDEAQEELGHEQAEAPEEEAAEHVEGPLTEEHDPEIEHLLSQLSPEQLEHLAAHLAEDMQSPEAHEGEDVAALAHAIHSHLEQNPEASVEDAPEDKQVGLDVVKSAEYISGFLETALQQGLPVKQAVDLYDNVLVLAVDDARSAIDANSISLEKAAYFEGFLTYGRENNLSDEEILNLAKSAGLASAIHGAKKSVKAVGKGISSFKKKLVDTVGKALNPSKAVHSLSKEVAHAEKLEEHLLAKNPKNPFKADIKETEHPFHLRKKASSAEVLAKILKGTHWNQLTLAARKAGATERQLLNVLGNAKAVRNMSHADRLKAVQDLLAKEQAAASHAAGGAASHAAGGAASHAAATASNVSNFDLLAKDYRDIEKSLKRGNISQAEAEFYKNQAKVRRLGVADIPPPPIASPKPPKAPTLKDIVSHKNNLDASVASGLHPEQAKQSLQPLVDNHIESLKNLDHADPFKNIQKAENDLQTMVNNNILTPEEAARHAEALKQHHLNVGPAPTAVPTPKSLTDLNNEYRDLVSTGKHKTPEGKARKAALEQEIDAARAAETAAQTPPPAPGPVTSAEAMDARAAELKKQLEELHGKLGTSEEAFQQHMAGASSIDDLSKQVEAAKKALSQQQLRHDATSTVSRQGVGANRKVKGVSRAENNRIVTDLNDGVAPDASKTFIDALVGHNGPRMSGITHNIANRLGGAAKTVVDNPITSGAVGLGLGYGTYKGMQENPENTPQEPLPYRPRLAYPPAAMQLPQFHG